MVRGIARSGRHALSHVESVFTVPDQFPVPEYLFNTVQWNTVQLALVVGQVEGKMIIGFEREFAHGHANDSTRHPVKVTKLELTLAEFPVPLNTVKQFMYGHHGTLLPWPVLYLASRGCHYSW
jgi:hypothetical protein